MSARLSAPVYAERNLVRSSPLYCADARSNRRKSTTYEPMADSTW